MSDLSNEYENRVANWLFAPSTSPTRPTALYMALYTAVSDAEAGTGTEVSGGDYARVDVTTKFGPVAGGTIVNTSRISWPNPTADWGTVTHTAICDALTGGNTITVIKPLRGPVVVNSGSTPPGFEPSEVSLTVL